VKMVSVAVLCAALMLSGRVGGAAAPVKERQAPQVSLTPDEALVLRLINEERRQRNLASLELDPVLVKVAREHSRDMARRGYFGHISPAPEGTTPLDRYASSLGRRPEAVVGENVGRAPQPVMGLMHLYMMESPEHRANILDAEYARVGVGIHALDDGRVWLTEMFGGEFPSDAPTSGS
jgi:uncharacterized protein YkwD